MPPFEAFKLVMDESQLQEDGAYRAGGFGIEFFCKVRQNKTSICDKTRL